MGISSARDFLEEWYGDRLVCNIVESDFSVFATPLRIAQQDPAVIARSISNNGLALIVVSSLAKVGANSGIPIPAGTTLNLFALEDFDLASCDLFAITQNPVVPVHVISLQIVGRGD